MSVFEPSLKEMEILESENEILSDIIVFDKNNSYENYVLVFELVPENKNDYHSLALTAKETISLSIYSFAEFEVVEIPFKKIDCFVNKKIHYGGSTAEINQDLQFPIFKFVCNYFGHYEIRVEGDEDLYYGVYIYKYQNYKNSILSKQYYKSSPVRNKGTCSMKYKLNMGNYAVQIVSALKSNDPKNKDIIHHKIPLIKKHDLNVQFISYSDKLVKNFEEHLPPKNMFTLSELKKKFTIKAISNGFNLIHKK